MKRKYIFFYGLLRPLVILFLKCKFGYRYRKATALPENYIVLSNHVTDFDPLFVGASFPRQMFFLGSEHIARWKIAYPLLKFALAPIVRCKGASAASALTEVIRRVKTGSNVCIFPEGVRSWDGVSCPILPSTAKLVKRLGCGLVTYKITGGYFVSPMWAGAGTRRGPIEGGPVHVYTSQQLAEMTVDQLYAAICSDLYEDAYARQLAQPMRYRSKRPAEHLERLLFVCPHCGQRDTFTSHGDTVQCSACQYTLRCDEYGMLHSDRFHTVKELSDWQKEQVSADLAAGMVYTAPQASLSTVKDHTETPLAHGPLSLSAETLSCGEVTIPCAQITDLAMHGQKAIVFTANKTYYELLPSEDSNALKFFLYYQACLHKSTETVR